MDIKKVDLSKLNLNPQDVALKGIIKLRASKSSIIIPDDISDATKKELEDQDELISLQIVAVGKEITFKVDQFVTLKSLKHIGMAEELNEDGSERLFIIGGHQIAYSLNVEDYES